MAWSVENSASNTALLLDGAGSILRKQKLRLEPGGIPKSVPASGRG